MAGKVNLYFTVFRPYVPCVCVSMYEPVSVTLFTENVPPEDEVARAVNVGITVFPAGELTRVAVAVIVSPPVPRKVWVTVVLAAAPIATVFVVAARLKVSEAGAAVEGVTVRRPKPKAATVPSAMRLKVVFVDICFLSISRVREFLALGLNQISLIRFDESHVLIHQIPRPISGRSEGISI